MKIRDRIKELRRVKASELIPNKKNWRKHPKRQKEAMRAVLNEVGFADALLARETKDGLVLLDGHLRADIDPKATVPVLILDVSEAEADKILATADPLQGMADTDWDALRKLTKNMEFNAPEFGEVLKEVVFDDALEVAPDSVRRNVEQLNSIRAQRKKANSGIISKTDTEKYLVVVFKSRGDREAALRRLGLPYDERYVPADALEISVAKSAGPRARRFGAGATRRLKAAPANRAGAQG